MLIRATSRWSCVLCATVPCLNLTSEPAPATLGIGITILERRRNTKMTYDDALHRAALLFDDVDEWPYNPEYLRGMCELISEMFPVIGVDLQSRAEEVREDIRRKILTQSEQ